MITAGVDIGSVATKAAVLCDGVLAGQALVRRAVAPGQAAEEALNTAAAEAGVDRTDIRRTAATGYGRRSVGLADTVLTEITAAARGAHHAGTPDGPPRLIIDLGGQDTKVILTDPDGAVRDFAMNDKCAAGTGRFLEVMAGVLEVSMEQLGRLGLGAAAPAPINATCTVFAESEVISLIARGADRADIVAGLHAAIASRIAQMARPMLEAEAGVAFIGGGSLNPGVRAALEQALGRRVHVPPNPQYIVALGAALAAAREIHLLT
jgi:(R)-2-hydroxyacyl-CoA dehydratese activating ATPase